MNIIFSDFNRSLFFGELLKDRTSQSTKIVKYTMKTQKVTPGEALRIHVHGA